MSVTLPCRDQLPVEEMFELLLDLYCCVSECDSSQDPPRLKGAHLVRLPGFLRQLAVAARAGGWCAYASVCLRVAERLQPLVEAGHLPQSTLRALTDWSRASLKYLTNPADRRRAAALLPPFLTGIRVSASPNEYACFATCRMMLTTMSAELVAYTREIGDFRRRHPGVQCAACSLEAPEIVVQTEIASSARKGYPLGVMCVGISRFSDLLDSMGRSSAEQLLQYVSHLLTQCVGDRGKVLRISEDRFLALLRGLDTPAVTDVASDILQLFSRAHEIEGCRTAISANIGVAMYPKDGSDGSSLITSAKVALNHARACGCLQCRFYTEHMKQAALKRATLEADMLRALELRQFSVHYQPKVSVSSGALRGAEALLRWNCPQRGWVPPADFIPIAEESGLILPLGEWVLEEVCRQARQWRVQNGLAVAMAVNMSPIQLRVGQTVNFLRALLQRHDMPPELLELEVTESSLMQDNEAAAQELRALTQQGVRIAIDDFGIGYSNLSRLGRLPVAALKVDRSLITHIDVRKCDRAIMRAVIAMARELGAGVVAEGVEKEEQLAVLRAIGCSECQGYLIARPMPPDTFIQWVLARGRPTHS